MKKIPHALIIFLGLASFVTLTALFVSFYIGLGDVLKDTKTSTVTLFKILTEIDWDWFIAVFLIMTIYMLILDLIVVFVVRSWRRISNIVKVDGGRKGRLARYWFAYRRLHIIFILLTLFGTLAVSAPSAIMNSFTAIVSISVLVSNLTKKIGK